MKFQEIINKQKEQQKILDDEKAKQEEEALLVLEEEIPSEDEEELEVFEIVNEEDEEEEDLPPAIEETTQDGPPALIKCKKCNAKFNNLNASIIHGRHKCTEIFYCKSCPNIYITLLKLEKHVKVAHNLPICEICTKIFKSHMLLNKHIRYTHDKKRHFKCDICGKEIIDITALRVHKESHKPKGEKRLYKFTRQKPQTKTSYVPAQKTNICEICGLTFETNQEYYMHYRFKHDVKYLKTKENKRFKCGQCDYSAFTQVQLTGHTRVHTGERPYKCSYCPSAFKLPNALKYHETSIHLGVKNHECKICGKKLADSVNLRAHLRRHTGEKPFICDICPEAFYEARPLRKHKAKAHPDVKSVESEKK